MLKVDKAFGVGGLQGEGGDEVGAQGQVDAGEEFEIEKTCDEAQLMDNDQTDEVQIASAVAVDVSHVDEVLSLKLNSLDWDD